MKFQGFYAVVLSGLLAAGGWILGRPDALDASEASREPGNRPAVEFEPSALAHHGDRDVRLNFFDATWASVLRDLAQQTKLTLVMPETPSGRFARRDPVRYTVDQAVRVISAELQPLGFCLDRHGSQLTVCRVDDARTIAHPSLSQHSF